ncbi:hypothetical protein RW115_11800 [Macrococcus capreoli]
MKQLISVVSLLLVVFVLTACTKEIKGDYTSFDKDFGQIDLSVKEKKVTMNFSTMNKAAEKASSGLFAPKIDTSLFELNGTIDTDKKVIKLKSKEGETIDATYEVEDGVLKMNIKNFKEGIKFYNTESDEYNKQSSKFNEEKVLENINL